MRQNRLFAVVGAFVLIGIGVALCKAQSLRRTRFSDGSGSIGLAAGWKVLSSGNGSVMIKGPHDGGVLLGYPVPVVSRNVAAKFPAIPSSRLFPGSPRVDFQNPVRAMLDLIMSGEKKNPGSWKNVKIKAVEETEFPNGRAAFVRLSANQYGKQTEFFGLYAITPVDDVQGVFYMSLVQGSKEFYAKQLPTTMAMWRSWSVSDATLKKRLQDAAKALGEVDVVGTMDGVMARRRKAAEEAALEFQKYIRQ